MSATLFLSGVAASFGAHTLFSGLDATIAPGDVTALVGTNGSGKSTLLRIASGEHLPDAGTVRLAPPEATIGYLPQSPPEPTESILDYALRRTGVGPALAEFEQASAELASEAPGSDERYSHALERWLALGGADLDVRLGEVVARLGLSVDLDRQLGTLSGGQAARAGLASILVSRFDILLLDEPTNNLDADGLEALTAFVATVGNPVLVASHDRAFLDTVATSVLELDLVGQSVNHYSGGWSDYREAKQLARAQAEQAYAAYAQRREDLVEQARTKTEWAKQGRAKSARLQPRSRLEKKYREDRARRMDQRAARVRDAVDRLEEVDRPRKEWELRFSIEEAAPSSEVVLTLDEVVARAGEFAVGPLSAQVSRGQRVALVGPNGSGKTTLLRAIESGTVAGGRVSWGTRTAFGIVDQARGVIDGEQSLVEAVSLALAGPVSDAAPGEPSVRDATKGTVRTLLAKFGLGPEHVNLPCSTLSLGERTRAALAVLQARAVNVLLLDEPTNHLDAAAIDQLESALVTFGGTLFIVTHDQALLEALRPDVIWSFEGTDAGATVRVLTGEWD